jgi:hypothetical protein
MKKIILASLFALPFLMQAQVSMGEVVGTIVSKKSKEALIDARIQTSSNGTIYRAKSDLDGRFRVSAVPAGKYLFEIIYQGDTLPNIAVNIPIDGIANIGTIEFTGDHIIELGVVNAGPPIFQSLTYGVASEIVMDREQISKSPAKFNQKEMIAGMSSEIKLTDDGSLVFRGSRKGDMIYVMDGIKMTEIANVPSAAIGGIMVYTGGIPAKYGDTLGGVVVMETLSYFDLYRAWYGEQLRSGKL